MSQAGFEPIISAVERLQTYALDLTVTRIDIKILELRKNRKGNCFISLQILKQCFCLSLRFRVSVLES